MKILLVRHGESLSNLDKKYHAHTADHAVPLSDKGKEQAYAAGEFLAEYLSPFTQPATGSFLGRLWVSPYLRTRQTANQIEKALQEKHIKFQHGRREHIMLCEQQFGLFDGYEDGEIEKLFPLEFLHYKKCQDDNGRFWARMPLGESRFDLAVRVHQSFGTFQRDRERHVIDTIVVVTHGATIRAFIMQWLNLPYEWFEEEKNPTNCSIRLIDEGKDFGYIFGGFPKTGPSNEVGSSRVK